MRTICRSRTDRAHTRGYKTPEWKPLDLAAAAVGDLTNDNPPPFTDGMWIIIDGKAWPSVRERQYDGHDAITPGRPMPAKAKAA